MLSGTGGTRRGGMVNILPILLVGGRRMLSVSIEIDDVVEEAP